MTASLMSRALLLPFLFLGVFCTSIQASLSEKQARKLIARMAGSQLSTGSVRIKQITQTATGAEATAEIETAFRLVQDEQRNWYVAEVRVGQDRWEDIQLATSNQRLLDGPCTMRGLTSSDGIVTAKRARCLIAGILGLELPSDSVRIRGVSSLGLPFTSSSSALVVALVQFDVRFTRDGGDWRVSELKSASGNWTSIGSAVASMNQAKLKRARLELETIAGALEAYRKSTGFYVAAENESTLIDHLSPRFLSNIIRLDPWHRPYRYRGEEQRFELRSDGPDGRENTPDDLIITNFSKPTANNRNRTSPN